MPPISKRLDVGTANSYFQPIATTAKLLAPVAKSVAKNAPGPISLGANVVDAGANFYQGNVTAGMTATASASIDALEISGKYIRGAAPVIYTMKAYNAGCFDSFDRANDPDCARLLFSAGSTALLSFAPPGMGDAAIASIAAANDVTDVATAGVTAYNDYQQQRQAARRQPAQRPKSESVVASKDLGSYYADRDGDTKPTRPAPRPTKTTYTATTQPVVVTATRPTYEGGTLEEIQVKAKNERQALARTPIQPVQSITASEIAAPAKIVETQASSPPVSVVDQPRSTVETPDNDAPTGVAAILKSEGLATDNTAVTPDRELAVSPEPTITETSTDNAFGVNAILETQAPIVSSEESAAVSEPKPSVLADPVITLPTLDEPVETAPLIAEVPTVVDDTPPSLLDFASDCMDCPSADDEMALEETFADAA